MCKCELFEEMFYIDLGVIIKLLFARLCWHLDNEEKTVTLPPRGSGHMALNLSQKLGFLSSDKRGGQGLHALKHTASPRIAECLTCGA